MLMLKIEDEDIKDFMNKLLRETMFDDFAVRIVEIVSLARFEISCIRENQEDGNEVPFLTWNVLRPYVFNIIKGGNKPRNIKIIFSCVSEQINKISGNASALFLNLTYSGNGVIFTTGTSQKVFALDKSHDIAWDKYINGFFEKNNLRFSNVEI